MSARPVVRYAASLALASLLCGLGTPAARAGGCVGDSGSGGLLHLDRCDEFEANGLFSRANQRRLDTLVIAGTVGVALWEGTDSAAGRTSWKSLDAMVATAAATELLKHATGRPRPSQLNDPDRWRQGARNKSFPSGETAMMAAFVTPLIADWHAQAPAVWALAALPVYMGTARMGSQAHWLSDVLAGAAIGTATGLWMAQRETPLLLAPFGDGVFIGWQHRF